MKELNNDINRKFFQILFFTCLPDDLIFSKTMRSAPEIMPESTVRKMTIARDASNFQKRKVIVTGTEFCMVKIVTRPNTIDNKITVSIFIV